MLTGKMRKITCLICLIIFTCTLLPAAQADLSGADWTCPACGRNNTAEMNFCGGCRTPKPAPEVDPSDAINGWVCSGCGHICPAADSFCTSCGSDHTETDASAILIDKPVPGEFQMSPCSVQRIKFEDGVRDGKYWYYIHTAQTDGLYCIWIEEQAPSFSGKINLYTPDDHTISTQDFHVNSPDTWHWFYKGDQFKIFFSFFDNKVEPFTLCIGEPRGAVRVQEPCVIQDSADYISQNNVYSFVPEVSGEYVLEMTEMKSGQSLELYVFDDLGYKIAGSSWGIEMGGHLTFNVEAGREYKINAIERSKYGPYKLSLFCPNPVVCVNGASAIGDAVYYPEQKNRYEYTAPVTANYTFTFGYTDKDTDYRVSVYDQLGYEVKRNQDGTVPLEAGKTYTIRVDQKKGHGFYTLLIDNDYVEPEEEHIRSDAEIDLIGKTVRFGCYEQDINPLNGYEEIEWIVLDAWGGKVLLLSRYGLDAKPYHDVREDVTWETCTLRKWLNHEFLNTAFNANEQAAILTTEVDNSESQCADIWKTTGGNNTQDKVFLLSWKEAEELYFSDSESRMCAPTDYAVSRGAWCVEDYFMQGHYEADGRPAGRWWLRSPGLYQYFAAIVYEEGFSGGEEAQKADGSVRPAIWVDLAKAAF